MHGCSVLQCCRDFAWNSPLALELESQGTKLIAVDRAGAESRSQIGCGRKGYPLGKTRRERHRLGFGKKRCLEFPAVPLLQYRPEFPVLQQFPQIYGRCLILLPASERSIDTQRVARARHRDVEKTTFLLFTKSLVIERLDRRRFPQLTREVNQTFS